MATASRMLPEISSSLNYQPLTQLLQSITLEALAAGRSRVAGLSREELIQRFQNAFFSGKRLAAYVMAEELTERGIPPAFRHHHLSSKDYSVSQKFDLMVYDLRWLRRRHSEHASKVHFCRSRQLFIGSDIAFHREAQYSFYDGSRACWKIVKSLRLTEEQQLECFWLHSSPVAKRLAGLQAVRDRVFSTLQQDLETVRRTKTFTDDDAKTCLFRRHRLWLCRGYTTGSPTAIAEKFAQLTGENIARQVVSRQLQIVDEILRKSRSSVAGKTRSKGVTYAVSQSLL